MSDILFTTLEKFHAGREWGRFLDAGTGVHSLKWIQALETTAWTAITADTNMSNTIMREASVAAAIRPVDSLIVGNWMDDEFCQNLGKFDTILADYLIGAVDGFSPYEQDTIIRRLKAHLNPNGRLYFIGMNPIPDDSPPSARIITEIRQSRDACILLAGHRPYREFPLTWITRHLEAAHFHVIAAKKFTILHSEDSAVRQIKVARSKLDHMKNPALRAGMDNYLSELESRARAAIVSQGGRIPLSFDYVMSIQHAEERDMNTATELSAEGTTDSTAAVAGAGGATADNAVTANSDGVDSIASGVSVFSCSASSTGSGVEATAGKVAEVSPKSDA